MGGGGKAGVAVHGPYTGGGAAVVNNESREEDRKRRRRRRGGKKGGLGVEEIIQKDERAWAMFK